MHLYGLIIGIAIIFGINHFSSQNTVITKKSENLFLFGLILSAVIGARIYHVIDQWSFYSQNLILIPQTWNGGLGIFGGIISALIFIYLYSYVLRVTFYGLLNSITPILPLCQAIGRFGNFVNHENPLWWPEAILDLILYFIIKKYPHNPTAKYLIGYGTIRFITEFWRIDTWIINSIKIGQIISIIFIIAGIILWTKAHPKLRSIKL